MSKNKIVTLKERLDRVYNSVDLRTTCKGVCDCCKVACPSMNYCEFIELIKNVWERESQSSKINMICTSIEYFFRIEFEKWGMETLRKPCMLLENGRCKYYNERPLACRIYGLWPEKTYNARVDKFEKAYEGLVKREDLPLNKQCPNVKRVDDSQELTEEIINDLFDQLDEIDKKVMQKFSAIQVSEKENYRTFHDWLLLQIFGEQWLSTLTSFMLAADKNTILSQIEELKKAVRSRCENNMPSIGV